MIWFLVLAILNCIISSAAVPEILSETGQWRIADLGYAKYQTNVSLQTGVISFLGIRYAASPAASMRWTPPRQPGMIPGIQNATAQPDQCPQAMAFGLSPTSPYRRDVADTGTSEDCLFLNVHIPAEINRGTRGNGYPVVVWIHGGGYDFGGNSAYPSQDFVKESNYGIVVVSIQYRLGLFGFLSGQAVREHGALNAGLLDQEFALQWVQEHIHTFGGDPSKVTIWGSSSGAGSVIQHLVANNGRTYPQLFRTAIMSSPYLPPQYRFDDVIPEAFYSQIVSRSGCESSANSLNCLRFVNVDTLSTISLDITSANFAGTFTFVPVVDGTFISDSPTKLLKTGRVNGENLLVITNANEGSIFVNESILGPANYSLTQYIAQLFPHLGENYANEIAQQYMSSSEAVLVQAAEVMGDSLFKCPGLHALDAFGVNAWKGFFAIPPATHGLDLSYEFLSYSVPPTFTNTDFQHAFSQAFMSTIMFSDPNQHFDSSNISPEWRNWKSDHTEMLFNQTETNLPVVRAITTSSILIERCNLWQRIARFTE